MSSSHDRRRRRVAEPVQVYLARHERQTLKRLADQLGLSMSDVIRRALAALEESVMHPERHPALRLIGSAGDERAPRAGYDVAAEHDRYLADVADPPVAGRARGKKRRGR